MHKLPNPEDIISGEDGLTFYDISGPFGERNWLEMINRVKEYGRQVRDVTLEWAAENAKLTWEGNPYTGEGSDYVDTQSILNGKTSKHLEI